MSCALRSQTGRARIMEHRVMVAYGDEMHRFGRVIIERCWGKMFYCLGGLEMVDEAAFTINHRRCFNGHKGLKTYKVS